MSTIEERARKYWKKSLNCEESTWWLIAKFAQAERDDMREQAAKRTESRYSFAESVEITNYNEFIQDMAEEIRALK